MGHTDPTTSPNTSWFSLSLVLTSQSLWNEVRFTPFPNQNGPKPPPIPRPAESLALGAPSWALPTAVQEQGCAAQQQGGREPRASKRVQWEEAPPPCVLVCVSVNEPINEHDEDADGPSCLRKCNEQIWTPSLPRQGSLRAWAPRGSLSRERVQDLASVASPLNPLPLCHPRLPRGLSTGGISHCLSHGPPCKAQVRVTGPRWLGLWRLHPSCLIWGRWSSS